LVSCAKKNLATLAMATAATEEKVESKVLAAARGQFDEAGERKYYCKSN
jgi:hypothetical protein